MWVLGVMYTDGDSLKKFDQVVVTSKEFASVCVWNERFNSRESRKLKKVSENYFAKNKVQIKQPPPIKVDDDEKAAK